MKTTASYMNELTDKRVKFKIEAENKDDEEMLDNAIKENRIRSFAFQLLQVSARMNPPVGETSLMALEIVL